MAEGKTSKTKAARRRSPNQSGPGDWELNKEDELGEEDRRLLMGGFDVEANPPYGTDPAFCVKTVPNTMTPIAPNQPPCSDNWGTRLDYPPRRYGTPIAAELKTGLRNRQGFEETENDILKIKALDQAAARKESARYDLQDLFQAFRRFDESA